MRWNAPLPGLGLKGAEVLGTDRPSGGKRADTHEPNHSTDIPGRPLASARSRPRLQFRVTHSSGNNTAKSPPCQHRPLSGPALVGELRCGNHDARRRYGRTILSPGKTGLKSASFRVRRPSKREANAPITTSATGRSGTLPASFPIT